MQLRRLLAGPARLYYGWRMIALGASIRMLAGGLHMYGFTVYFLPLSHDLGLSRAATSLAFSLARAEGAIEGPVAGYMIDRFGPRPVMLIGVVMTGVGYMLFSTVNTYLTFLLVYLGVISLGFGAGFMHAPMVLANTWFIRKRALAMTMISGSVALGGAFVAPLLSLAVQRWGWRTASLLGGLGVLVVGLPMAAMVRRSPESMGLRPDGDSLDGPSPSASVQSKGSRRWPFEADFTVREAMGTAAFWMLILATMLRVAGLSAVLVHFIPIMVWKGLSEQKSALLLANLALFGLPAHLFLGWLADYVEKPRLMAATMLVATTALLTLIHGQSELSMWLFTILFTAVEAVFPITWATVGDFFGRRTFATVRGTMSFFYMWGAVLAPVVAGALYDRSQTYSPMLWGLVGLYLVTTALYSLLSRPLPHRRAA
ncbi:MAG: MFS transporter [Deltaproteobacteria bacterium]|nr:MFS transporter [Deltaproteobacteria bacterium]